MAASFSRRLGATGVLFAVLFVVSGSLVTEKSPHTAADQIAAFYTHHRGGLNVEAHIIGVAVLVGLAYYWYLRELIGTTTATRRLANLGFVGVLFYAMGGELSAGVDGSLSDVATHASAQTIQTLSVLQSETSDVASAGGVALFLIATGIAVVRGRVLYRWLGWVGIVLGVGSLVIPDLSPVLAGAWTLVVSVVLLVRPPSVPAMEHPDDQPVASTAG